MKVLLRDICHRYTDLCAEDIGILEDLQKKLPMMSELTGSDIFIDCFTREGQAVVAAHASPEAPDGRLQLYTTPVAGQFALAEKEPAVYRCRELGAPVRDIRAITQEDHVVRQSVVPVWGSGNEMIGVLIQEEDISKDLLKEKKLKELARSVQTGTASEDPQTAGSPNAEMLMLREVNHRVKNQLQLVASILNIQARRCGDSQAGELLRENSARVLSIAACHDIISHTNELDRVNIEEILNKILQTLRILVPEDRLIRIELDCPFYPVPGEVAGNTAMVITELVINSIEYAFPDRKEGRISVVFSPGILYHTVTVRDDGQGITFRNGKDGFQSGGAGLGLRLVKATVEEKLRGHISVSSENRGTSVVFDIQASS